MGDVLALTMILNRVKLNTIKYNDSQYVIIFLHTVKKLIIIKNALS